MDHPEQSPTCVSFCYGIGGLDHGLEEAIGDLCLLVIVEIEAVAIANVVAKIEQGAMAPTLVYTDVKSFPARLFRNRVDWFLGGYPCQPFSIAGKRGGVDDPRHLFPYFESAIRAMRPVHCLLENVAGHLTLGFPEVYRSLRKLGYVVEAGIFSAEEVGATHKRERLFILAIREDVVADFRSRRLGQEHEVSTRRDRLVDGRQNVAYTNWFTERQQANKENTITEGRYAWQKFRSRSEALEHSDSERLREERGCEIRSDFAGELDHTDSGEPTTNGRESGEDREVTEGECGPEHGTVVPRRTSSSRSGQVGNADESGSQGRQPRVCEECSCEWTSRSNGPFDRERLLWPAGPGSPQFEWESPRTVITDQAARLLGGYSEKYPESFLQWQVDQVAKDGFAAQVKPSLGCSTDGYDFREDFLRAIGNAVCPPQAKRAVAVLLKKHLLIAEKEPDIKGTVPTQASAKPTPTVAEAGKISNKANYGQKGLSNHPEIVGTPNRGKLSKSRGKKKR